MYDAAADQTSLPLLKILPWEHKVEKEQSGHGPGGPIWSETKPYHPHLNSIEGEERPPKLIGKMSRVMVMSQWCEGKGKEEGG